MTLHTTLVLHEWTDPVALHTWFNANVLRVSDKNPVIDQSATHIGNALGQGFDAIFDVDWQEDHTPLVWHDAAAELAWNLKHIPDVFVTEEDAREDAEKTAELYAHYPLGVIKIAWDTSYAFRARHGGAAELHAEFIIRLAKEYLEPRGITFAWQNEFSGEWNEGLTGFEDFGQNGRDAEQWFHTVALPAVLAEADRRRADDGHADRASV